MSGLDVDVKTFHGLECSISIDPTEYIGLYWYVTLIDFLLSHVVEWLLLCSCLASKSTQIMTWTLLLLFRNIVALSMANIN